MNLHLETMSKEEAMSIDSCLFKISIEGELFNSNGCVITADRKDGLMSSLTLGVDYQFNTIIIDGYFVMALTTWLASGESQQIVIRAGKESDLNRG